MAEPQAFEVVITVRELMYCEDKAAADSAAKEMTDLAVIEGISAKYPKSICLQMPTQVVVKSLHRITPVQS